MLLSASLAFSHSSIIPGGRSNPQDYPVDFRFHRQALKTINQVGDTLWANSTQRWSSSVQTENRTVRNTQPGVWEFYTQPALAADISIASPVSLRLWFSASAVISGATLQVSLISVSPTGAKTTLGSDSSVHDITLTASEFVLMISSLSSGNIAAGHILEFQITMNVSGGTNRIATLSFDTASEASSAVLTLSDHFAVQTLAYYNSSLVLTYSFSKNWSAGERQVVAISTITDELGLFDISQVALTVTNPAGGHLVNSTTMTRLSGLDTSYTGTWQVTFPFGPSEPSGTYDGTVTVSDQSGNLIISQVFSFSIFSVWSIDLSTSTSPPSPGPLPNVAINAYDGSTLVWSSITDGQGNVRGLLRDDTRYDLEATWQGSIVGRYSNLTISGPYSLNVNLQVRLFEFSTLFRDGDGRLLDSPLQGLTLTAPNGSIINPNPAGSYYLQDGPFAVNSVLWKGLEVVNPGASFNPATPSTIPLKIYDLSVIVTDPDGRALQGANVTVVYGGTTIASGLTDSSGLFFFSQLPSGQFALTVRHSQGQTTTSITLDATKTTPLQISPPSNPPASLDLSLFAILIGSAGATMFGGFAAYRNIRRLRIRERGFEYLDEITGGGIPRASSIVIMGDAGSGKTLLSEQLAIDWLKKGKTCVYISYGSLPDEIRSRMDSLGLDSRGLESAGKLAIVDCYSAQAKVPTSSNYALEKPFDLTSLGINLGQALKRVGEENPLVIVDPLSPLFNKIPPMIVVNFLEDKAAKVKGLGGTTILAVGNGTVSKETMGSIQAVSDGILELSASPGKEGIRRSLRVRKMKNQTFKETSFDFKIKPSKGIRFLTKRGVS